MGGAYEYIIEEWMVEESEKNFFLKMYDYKILKILYSGFHIKAF